MSESYFLPPMTTRQPSEVELRTKIGPDRAFRSPRFRAFYRTLIGQETPGKPGKFTAGGTDYLGGRWNGPLTAGQVTALTAAGYAARIVTVAKVGDLPPGLD